jgi:hypothetical protein
MIVQVVLGTIGYTAEMLYAAVLFLVIHHHPLKDYLLTCSCGHLPLSMLSPTLEHAGSYPDFIVESPASSSPEPRTRWSWKSSEFESSEYAADP